jgi:photosystem II stability/assembly factor-like uncharacterized protein
MAVSLTNMNGKISLSYITGNGILSTTNGKIAQSEGITEIDLSSELQNKINSIDTINSEISAIETNIESIETNIESIETNITSIETNITSIETTIENLGSGGGGGGLTLENIVPVIKDTTTSYISNFGKQWYTAANAGTPNIINIATSGDGKYIFVCPWSVGSAQFSTDYGETWTTPLGVSANIWSCAMNLDGKYIILADNNNYKVSTNYGVSFTIPTNRPFSLQQASLSATGKYIACACSGGNGLQVSSDYGDTWTQRETTTYTWSSVATSIDGSIIYGCSDNGLIKKSVDYGESWTTIYTDANSSNLKTLCCSGDGKYVLATFNSNSKILLSIDYGSNFNLVGDTATYYTSAMSKNGMYMIAAVNGSSFKYSINYGANWTTISNNKFTAVAMSYNGESIYNVSPYNKVIISRNNDTVITSTQPAIATIGSNYFDTATNKLFIYNGTDWKSITLS